MSETEQPNERKSSGRSKDSKPPRSKGGRGAKPRPLFANEWAATAFIYLAVGALCWGGFLYLSGSPSASPAKFIPFALSLAAHVFLRAWHLLFDDVSTIVGLVVLAAGFISFYASFTSPDAGQKSDFKDLGLALVGGGLGVLVGQRLPRSAKRIDDDNPED